MSTSRQFEFKPVVRCYTNLPDAEVDRALYESLSASGHDHPVKTFTVPSRSGLAWELKAGQTCRIITRGAQVGDINIWNLVNPEERFYSGKTRQIHRTHLSSYDRLWSCHPWLRPLATITQDSLADYGIDNEGLSVHDVTGTRCEPYMHKMMTGLETEHSCHQYLTKAIKPWGLEEKHVHDVFNIFMCTGFSRETHEFVVRGTPARDGDYIEWVAEMDLLVALSACPAGDVSASCGSDEEPICFPMDVIIGQPAADLLAKWRAL